MARSRHFNSHWKELLAMQAAAADDSKEAEAEAGEDADGGRFPALVFVRCHRRGVLLACLSMLAMCAAVVSLAPHASSTARRPLYGRVQADGLDVTRGSITFLPVSANLGPAANAAVVDGKYRFTGQTGPGDGPHRVLIASYSLPDQEDVPAPERTVPDAKSTGEGAILDRNAASGASTEEEQPSAKLERRWEFEYTVPERGPDRKDFEL